MSLFSFGSNNKLPFSKTLKLKRLRTPSDVNKGEKLKLWYDKKKNLINVYAKGSYGDEGLLATISDRKIIKQIEQPKVKSKSEVIKVSDNYIDLNIELFN
jgi:hypothetical protein